MMRLRRLFSIAAVLVALAPSAFATDGILLLAHGTHGAGGHGAAGHEGHAAPNPWNANVDAVAAALDKRHPTEVAFGMAEAPAIQAAITRLERRGVTRIAAVPLFVSSHSPIIGNTRYILGLADSLAQHTSLKSLPRAKMKARAAMSGALDAHPFVSEILMDRARQLTADPSETAIVLIAHGPNAEEENRLWLKEMAIHTAFLRDKGRYAAVEHLTHRNDASAEIKAKAREEFRARVLQNGKTKKVVVVPLLMSAGGIEGQVKDDLAGLSFRFAEPLLPHPNIERWVLAQATALWKGME
ncbi:MAG: sirohydrochlorin chelatase [Rhodospirillaceae bacterium]